MAATVSALLIFALVAWAVRYLAMHYGPLAA